jgi:hypothetical protein
LCEYSGQGALNTMTNDLTQVSVPAKQDHNSHQSSHMSLRDQHFHAHSVYTIIRLHE